MSDDEPFEFDVLKRAQQYYTVRYGVYHELHQLNRAQLLDELILMIDVLEEIDTIRHATAKQVNKQIDKWRKGRKVD